MTIFTIDGHKYTVYETEDNDFAIMEIVPEGRQTPEAIVAYQATTERPARYFAAAPQYRRRYKAFDSAYTLLRDDFTKSAKVKII